MNNKLITAITYLFGAILLVVGPHTIFKICKVGEKPMRCYFCTKAEMGIAIILIITAILYFFTKTIRERLLLTIVAISNSIVALLIPRVLIGGCGMKTMACRAVAFPAFYVISASLIIFSAVSIFYLTSNDKRNLVNINVGEQKNNY